MKKTSLLLLIAAGLLSVLLSSCSSTFTAAGRTRLADPVGYIDQTRIADPVDYLPPSRAEGQPYEMHSPHP
jgi:hypothetical protein